MIYNISGDNLSTAYDINGNPLLKAYDIDGNVVFPSSQPEPEPEPDTYSIKVMTYNVGGWYIGSGTNVPSNEQSFFYLLQNGMISNNNADLLIIEEYWNVFSANGVTARSLLSQYYPYIHEENGTSKYMGRCICSKFPISNYTTHSYSNEPDRYYDDCTVNVDGKQIHILVTHPGLTAEVRAVQYAELIVYLKTLDSFICGGDYNAPSGYAMTPDMTEIQPFFEAGFNLANCSTLGNFITSSNDPTSTTLWKGWIDNICTSPDITPISAYVDETKLTAYRNGQITKVDHMPFVSTVQWELNEEGRSRVN